MKLIVDPKIFEQHPDLKIGVIIIKGLNNTRRVSSVESLLRGVSAQRGREFIEKDIYADPMIAPWAAAYGKFGVNPKKKAPSIAALIKRVSAGQEIPHINLLVDLYNYFSLKHMLPIGGEDLDWLCGDLHLTFTKGKEAFRPIGSIDVEEAAEGEVAYMDQGGITSRLWNHRECERTKFTKKTNNAVLFIEDLSKMHIDKFGAILKEIQNSIIKYIGGQIEPYILTEDRREIDLGIRGRQSVNDSKVTQQEKAHHVIEQAKKKPSEIKKAKPKIIKLTLEDEFSYKSQVKKLLSVAANKAFPDIEIEANIEYPSSSDHGDYASNIAMQLTKKVGIPPRKVAEKILENFKQNELIKSTEIAGPGFINIHLKEEALNFELEKVLKEGDLYGSTKMGKGKNIVMDYSSPNIAKPLGVHHLLSTVIGQSLNDIYTKLGFNVVAINHIGDWGTQFGKLICAYKKWGDRATIEANPIAELLKLYVKFHNEAEKDSSLEDKGRLEFKNFEEGDKENHKLWEWFVEESMKDLQKTYDNLGGIHFDHVMGESFYQDKMAAILERGKKEGLIVEGEEGAQVIHFEDENIATVPVQKKDGATLYITRDLATMKYRIDTWKPVRSLYVVDSAQSMHFKQLFDASRRLNLCNDEPVHISFGRMSMKDGKMSTRKGNVVLLDDVLIEAVERAMKLIEEKSAGLKDTENVARVVGIGAIKYNILSQNRNTNIVFDWEKMLSFEGNNAPYLQYAYARAKSILRRAEEDTGEGMHEPENADKLTHNLMRMFPKFTEQIASAASEYKPNIVSNYIYDLAQKFNSFYNTVPVLRASNPELKAERLKIVEASAQILKNGLALLGVKVVEEM